MYLKLVFPPLMQQFWSVWNDCTHMYPYVSGVWWWVLGPRSVFKVTSEVFSWDQDLSFCRPVKFFHTDSIIISLWSLPYTQRHCHVRIEKGSVQTVAIKLEAHNSLEYHYMLKHYDLYSWKFTKVVKLFIRRDWPNTFGNIVYYTLPPTYYSLYPLNYMLWYTTFSHLV